MNQITRVKFDSPEWGKVDEYEAASPFIDVGFKRVKDVVDLRVFDLLNISRINNNRAEEMLLCIQAQTFSLTGTLIWYPMDCLRLLLLLLCLRLV